MKKKSISYFIHGTHIDQRIWSNYIIEQINLIFCNQNVCENRMLQWCGTNSTLARDKAGDELLDLISIDVSESIPDALNIIGHSHGGTIALMKSDQLRRLLNKSTEINFITINTPSIIGGPKLLDNSINHYNVVSVGDKVTPIAGFDKTGIINQEIINKTLIQKIKFGEFSHRKPKKSGVIGSVDVSFPNAINVFYSDQYWLKGLDPRTHFSKHRGYLKRNVKRWIPLLKKKRSKHLEKNNKQQQ